MDMLDSLLGLKKKKKVLKGTTLDNKPIYNLSDSTSELTNQSRFIFLGSFGKKDQITYKKVKQAIREIGYEDDVLFVRDNTEVIKFGVVNTPAIVVDGIVVTYGKYFEIEDVKELFRQYKL